MKKILLLVGALSLAAVAAWGQSTPIIRLDGSTISQEQVDKIVSEAMSGAQVPGVALAILNRGRAVYVKGYGLRDKERDLPMTANTVMTGASFSKVAFAYMVLQLIGSKACWISTSRYINICQRRFRSIPITRIWPAMRAISASRHACCWPIPVDLRIGGGWRTISGSKYTSIQGHVLLIPAKGLTCCNWWWKQLRSSRWKT